MGVDYNDPLPRIKPRLVAFFSPKFNLSLR